MKVAILSGKGGTGKTFVGTNLAALLPSAVYVDCDVEEPNGHLFLQPTGLVEEEVKVPVPVVNDELCTACRTCVDFCRYNALALIGQKVKVFADICHSCGGCALFCPEKAIHEIGRSIGTVSRGTYRAMATQRVMETGQGTQTSKNSETSHRPCLSGSPEQSPFYSGRLNPGEASGVPLIEAVLRMVDKQANISRQVNISEQVKCAENKRQTVIIDCPPGSACVVMESIKDADFCLLVAEPTIFGAHNLQMVHELVTLFNKPHGVLLNKDVPDETNPSAEFCQRNHVAVLGSIPYSQEVAGINASGGLAVHEFENIRELFLSLAEKIGLQGGVS